jgi:hypothetical protein
MVPGERSSKGYLATILAGGLVTDTHRSRVTALVLRNEQTRRSDEPPP